ncbi:hypothetical protein J2D73_20015 [Acetobacter sacchari]|uniref:Uncharacterized protein n=1 Tax=Acetobacter sacchari TaxID=2661687 RepID=A0ABS3M1V5_9PROT|nr:hypothetical protein [Acetobacter sacchari]MBO1362071.1 hypothetical protein [Acetobacter sacchari]
MKIEIDLNEILRDEYGDAETMAESIHRQIVETVAKSAKEGVKKKIDEEVSAAIQSGLAVAVKEQMPALMDDLLNATYTPVDTYGRRSEPTTMRDQLIKTLTENMVYRTGRYDSDKNAFAKAVDSIIEAQMKEFKKEFDSKIDANFRREALTYATNSLLAKLGIPQDQ